MELNSVYIISFFIMTALVPALNSLCQPMSSNSILRPEEVIELSMLCKGVIFTQTKFGLSHDVWLYSYPVTIQFYHKENSF